MDIDNLIQITFQTINAHLENIPPTKIALENAIQRPIYSAFASIPKQDYRKLYREISKITHPDKINQQRTGDPQDPIVLFHARILQLSEGLGVEEKDNFINAIQQLVENYKNSLPDSNKLIELAFYSSPMQAINELKKAFMACLSLFLYDSQRYNLYAQYLVYIIQIIVNIILISSLCIIAFTMLPSNFLYIFLMYNPNYFLSSLVACCLVYESLKEQCAEKKLDVLSFFIGQDSIDSALKESISISELAQSYRHYFDDIEFTDEDSDEVVLEYAKQKLGITDDLDHMKLRSLNFKRRPIWQYVQILCLGFYKMLQTPVSTFKTGFISQEAPSHPGLSQQFYSSYKPNAFHKQQVMTDSEAQPPHLLLEPNTKYIWLDYNRRLSSGSFIVKVLNPLHVSEEMIMGLKYPLNSSDMIMLQMRTGGIKCLPNLPLIYQCKNVLYAWNNEKNSLQPLNFTDVAQLSLPSCYVRSSDGIFYYDDVNKKLKRLQFDTSITHCPPKSHYILFGERFFYYDHYTNICKEINAELSNSTLKEKFPYGTRIEELSDEQLAFIQSNTEHSNRTVIAYTMAVCLKIFRTVIFIPFIVLETLSYTLNSAFNIALICIFYIALVFKLSATVLLNLPLYTYEWLVPPQSETQFNAQQAESLLNQDIHHFITAVRSFGLKISSFLCEIFCPSLNTPRSEVQPNFNSDNFESMAMRI